MDQRPSEESPKDAPRLTGEGPQPKSRRSEERSKVAENAIYGLFWAASTGLSARVLSLLSTLLLTRYVAPEDYGEVQSTYILVWMIDLIAQLGLPQYVACRADITKKHIEHATLFFHVLGVVGLSVCLLVARPLGPVIGAPQMYKYMPGFVVSHLFQRIALMPDRMLIRQLRFRASSVMRAMSEIVYALVSLSLAMFGKDIHVSVFGQALSFDGGFAIVWGNIVRALFRVAAVRVFIPARRWFAFPRLDWQTTRHVLSFGVPITLAGLGSLGSKRWDNLAIGNLYGASSAGIYNFGYNLADVPPSIVGEALGDVLGPSLARVDAAHRVNELLRWMGFTALLCFPLGVGLSAVAPSLSWLLKEEWLPAVTMLILLGSLSLTRPVTNSIYAYLQIVGRARALMFLEWSKALLVVLLIAGTGRLVRLISPDFSAKNGPYVACMVVGFVHLLSMLSYQVVASRSGGVRMRLALAVLVRPLLACVPMVGAVLAVRLVFGEPQDNRLLIVRLLCEILAGALVFVVCALTIARSIAVDFVALFKTALLKREIRA